MTHDLNNGIHSTPVPVDHTIDKLILLMAANEGTERLLAMDILCCVGFKSVAPVLEKAIRNDDNADLRNGAMEVFVRFGSSAVPHLMQLLDDQNEEVRNLSTVMLGYIGSSNAVDRLCCALKDSAANVRHGAAEALGKIGDQRALLPLADLLRGDTWDKFYAVAALGDLGDVRAIPMLIEIETNNEVKDLVAVALKRLYSQQKQ